MKRQDKPENKTYGTLSNRTRVKIEKSFSQELESGRDKYLSHEIEKYRDLKIIIKK